MDLVIILIWMVIAVGRLCAIISSSYYVYVRGVRPFDIFAKLLVALIAYGLLTFGTGFLAGMVLLVGAHSQGTILGSRELLIGSVILILYAAMSWPMCSFIVGRLILPNRFSTTGAQ